MLSVLERISSVWHRVRRAHYTWVYMCVYASILVNIRLCVCVRMCQCNSAATHVLLSATEMTCVTCSSSSSSFSSTEGDIIDIIRVTWQCAVDHDGWRPSPPWTLTFRHGFGLTSNDALNFLLWLVVRMVLGLFGPFGWSASQSSRLLSSPAATKSITIEYNTM